MSKINCYIAKDLLPLYVDDVLSEESKNEIENHISTCADCKKEHDLVKKNLIIPIDNDSVILKKIKRKLLNKKIIVSAISSVLALAIGTGCFCYYILYATTIPYEKENFSIEQVDNTLNINYTKGAYYKTTRIMSENIVVDGEEKTVDILFFEETLSSKREKTNTDDKNSKHSDIEIENIEDIDIVYYGDFSLADEDDTMPSGYNWDEAYKNATVIWENDK